MELACESGNPLQQLPSRSLTDCKHAPGLSVCLLCYWLLLASEVHSLYCLSDIYQASLYSSFVQLYDYDNNTQELQVVLFILSVY